MNKKISLILVLYFHLCLFLLGIELIRKNHGWKSYWWIDFRSCFVQVINSNIVNIILSLEIRNFWIWRWERNSSWTFQWFYFKPGKLVTSFKSTTKINRYFSKISIQKIKKSIRNHRKNFYYEDFEKIWKI